PRRPEAVAAGRREAGRQRRGLDAAVQGHAQQQADRGRLRLRGQSHRRLNLPTVFPRDLKVVATDFDRTLVGEDVTLHPRTIAALQRARKAGLHVIVVTGRMVQSIRQAIAPAQLDDPVICYQGAVVADADGTWLRHEPIPLELARETIAALGDAGFSPNVYVDDELYVAEDTPEARRYSSLNKIPF